MSMWGWLMLVLVMQKDGVFQLPSGPSNEMRVYACSPNSASPDYCPPPTALESANNANVQALFLCRELEASGALFAPRVADSLLSRCLAIRYFARAAGAPMAPEGFEPWQPPLRRRRNTLDKR